jgi:hypothetical protein
MATQPHLGALLLPQIARPSDVHDLAVQNKGKCPLERWSGLRTLGRALPAPRKRLRPCWPLTDELMGTLGCAFQRLQQPSKAQVVRSGGRSVLAYVDFFGVGRLGKPS